MNFMKRVLSHAEFKVGIGQNYPLDGREDTDSFVATLRHQKKLSVEIASRFAWSSTAIYLSRFRKLE